MIMKENQKIRPLAIYQLLKNHTDSSVAIGSFEIAQTLNLEGLPSSIKEVKDDLKLLKDWGFGVNEVQGEDLYYLNAKVFSDAELRIIIDAIESATFITEKKTMELVRKISRLAGESRAQSLINKSSFSTIKHTNENVFNAVATLDSCIRSGMKCSFLYFDYDVEGSRLYRKERRRYVVNPLALTFSEDKYYLLAYGDKYENVASYRVDRMDKVMPEGENVTKAEWLKNFDLNAYKKQSFSMFKGDIKEVSLECKNEAVDVVIDKFGEKVNMLKLNDDLFRVKVTVQISPTFFGWCATSGGRIKIVAPEEVKLAYYEHLSKC